MCSLIVLFSPGINHQNSKLYLAKEVLAEIPDQVTQYAIF